MVAVLRISDLFIMESGCMLEDDEKNGDRHLWNKVIFQECTHNCGRFQTAVRAVSLRQ